MNLDEPKKALPLLKEKYELLIAGGKVSELDLNALLPGTVQPMVLSLSATGDREGAKTFVSKVKKDLAEHEMASQIAQFLDQITAEINTPGKGDVLEIAFTDLNGEKVDLASMKGKVVLVDFWATWCGPCVAELPNVLDAYKKHHDKGFEIIGISLDQDEAALKSFIKENDMPWTQYFDGKGWKNDIAQKYSITSIPATFLIGKNGKVVASNLRGPQLEAEVALQLKSK
ncbi:MAG: TlpA family protein disulfide reductase [Verrucomicrobia bacterium]|nr:TlpA family protein disulfide reductase [Verrucomicrobiota bacterium]